MLSVVIGLSAAIVIGALAIIVVLRLPCGGRRRNRFKRKELSQGTTTGEGSPGPSDKSIGSRELDGNESDEKNPDIIPDTVDSDDQVSQFIFYHLRHYASAFSTFHFISYSNLLAFEAKYFNGIVCVWCVYGMCRRKFPRV